MKKYLLFCQLILISLTEIPAQLSVGPAGLTILNGTNFYSEGLVMIPSIDLNLSNQTLTKSPVAAPGFPPGINRVYYFTSSFTYRGTVGFNYTDSELNGNSESALNIAYGNPGYTEAASSTVDATSNYISTSLNAVILDRITAASPGALPVTLISFTVNLSDDGVNLQWETSSEINSDNFDVERSTDMQKWVSLQLIQASGQSAVFE